MKSKRIVVTFCVLALLVTAFAAGEKNLSGKQALTVKRETHAALTSETIVPDHVVYGFLFQRVVSVKGKIKELQAQRRIARKPTFPLQKEANLSEAQAIQLEAIAFACQQEVAQQDEKARAIIIAFRSQFPDGRIPDGVTPSTPPELKVMWEERNAIILRARDQLRATLGEQEFHRFDQYAKFPYGADDVNIERRRESMNLMAHEP